MKKNVCTILTTALFTLLLAGCAGSGVVSTIAGSQCQTPPRVVCVEGGCREQFAPRGDAVDPATGRAFFLDFPCDLQPGEDVTFILNIHGGGSIGNWQRHYFPAVDYVDDYRLVVATPTAATDQPVRAWRPEADDEHLQSIVTVVMDELGRDNIKAFWLAGHSQGGMTSNRIVCTEFFRDKVDGWLSLSGGRIGPAQVPDVFGVPRVEDRDPNTPGPGAAVAPTCDISYIFASGELEIESLPDTSPWAEKYRCDARVREADIVDTEPGYVTATDQSRGAYWGRNARPGTAEVYVYPNCDDGKVVADVLRLDKGHTEGLEPKVTQALINMMVTAPGGKLRDGG